MCVGCPPARLLHPAEPCALRYRDSPLPRCCAQPSQSHRGCRNAPCTSQCGEMEAQGVGMRGDPCPGCVIGESSGGGKWAEVGWREVVPSLILSRGGGEWNVFLPPPPPKYRHGGCAPQPPHTHFTISGEVHPSVFSTGGVCIGEGLEMSACFGLPEIPAWGGCSSTSVLPGWETLWIWRIPPVNSQTQQDEPLNPSRIVARCSGAPRPAHRRCGRGLQPRSPEPLSAAQFPAQTRGAADRKRRDVRTGSAGGRAVAVAAGRGRHGGADRDVRPGAARHPAARWQRGRLPTRPLRLPLPQNRFLPPPPAAR